MADSKVEVEVAVLDNATKSISRIEASLQGLTKQLNDSKKQASIFGDVFKGAFAADIAVKGLGLIKDAASAAFNTLVVEGVAAAQKTEDALNQLNVALAQSGQFSEEASKGFVEFASEIEKTTKVSDDAVLSAAALIQQIAQLGTGELKQATQSAIDLSAALGIDLDSAARLVGKAMEGNVEAFKRYGVEVRKGRDETETMNNVFQALSRFSGAAAAQLNTFSGATAFLSNGFENLQKVFGNAIIQNQAVIQVIKELGAIFFGLGDSLKDNNQSFKVLVGEGLLSFVNAIGISVLAVDALTQGFRVLFNTGSLVVRGIVGIFEALSLVILKAIEPLGSFLPGLNESIKGSIAQLEQGLAETSANITEDFKDIEGAISGPSDTAKVLTENIARVGVAAERGLAQVKAGEPAATQGLKNIAGGAKQVDDAFIKLAESGAKLVQDLAKKSEIPTETLNKQLDAIAAAEQQKLVTAQEAAAARTSLAEQFQTQEEERRLKEVEAILAQNEELRQINTDEANAQLQANQQKIDGILTQEEQFGKARLAVLKNQRALADKQRDQEIKDQDAFLSTAATLQRAKSKELAAIGKAAAITQIAIATPPAVASSFKFGASIGGPPLGFVFAAIAATAMAAQAAAIAGVPLAKGIDSVPGTGNQDNFPAVLAPGERVVPRESNRKLTEFLDKQGSTEGLLASIDEKLGRLQNMTVVQIGEKVIASEVRSALEAGRVIVA